MPLRCEHQPHRSHAPGDPTSYGLHPYLNFPGTAREAMEAYRSIFGGDLTISTFGEYHAVAEGSESADKVMNAEPRSEHIHLSASDVIAETPIEVTFGNAFTLALTGDDEAALRAAFERLADVGEVIMPLQTQIWGDVYGHLVDRFGTGWQVDITGVTDAETA